MIKEFKKHIDKNFPFLKESKLLLAISGGIDSVVLAHLLKELNLNFSLAHCNFKLRFEDADKDEQFVIQLAKKLKIESHIISFETKEYANSHKLSTQMAARELRYDWFEKLVESEKYQYVLTAHHANDNLETVLINLTRGATLNKLTGIPESNGNIIRPLLPYTRTDIEQFAIDYKIIWREDESNQSTKYFRNKIRHQVIPVLQTLNNNVLQTFNAHLEFLKSEQSVLQQHLKNVAEQISTLEETFLKIDVKALQKLENKSVYLHFILEKYGFSEWNNITDLVTAQSGKWVISKTHRLIKHRDFLILEKNTLHLDDFELEIGENCSRIDNPIRLYFETVDSKCFSEENTIFVDAKKLKYPLCLRKKKAGDVFYPFGMKGKKKVSKYFKDEKLSLSQKENIWLLCNNNNEIIWIVDKRADNRFSVTNETQKIIKIKTNPPKPNQN